MRPSHPRPARRAGWRGAASAAARLALALSLVGLVGGCARPDPDAVSEVRCPTAEFVRVSAALERRCGTLDCHGDVARPLRIYGQTGLRRPERGDPPPPYISDFSEYHSGGLEPTTSAELESNRRAVCGLEPERMAEVVTDDAPVSTLTLVRKPRLAEAHKGGQVWPEGSEGDRCLTSWLRGEVDTPACDTELSRP